MTKLEAIATAKTFRKDADELLQRMKEHRKALQEMRGVGVSLNVSELIALPKLSDGAEAIAQHTLSIRDLESCIMRQGMALKYIGNPDPYPESRDPSSPVVAPTADNLKL